MTSPARHIVVMGVSGAGKSTIGRVLADELAVSFGEGDDFHPAVNIAKMASGEALNDEDRIPWLALLRDWMTEKAVAGQNTVVSCSALLRTYRDALRAAEGDVLFVLLQLNADEIAKRVNSRSDHFMPASLVASQLAALEPPASDEGDVIELSASRPIADLVQDIRAAFVARAESGSG